ncbi:extracellular solute-binding protein [Streptomyces sp. N2-109]|uniref:Extracellular solute-binding protein n=1 Tax=Streptomyces gossypii TaxID=2883101 RepID=A0ABT2JV61_9ACTN|nr:extracellular solute-binding protein [Streptomyces gossypii]MCT2591721.1 extracellular solute-binding protein [Streptomyces gossypii]
MRGRSGMTLAAVMSVAVMTACGGSEPGEGSDAGAASAWALTGGSEDAFRASFDSWNNAHPDQKISSEWFANDAYKEKIRTAVGSGKSPTLIYSWAGGTLADYVRNDSVVDITDGTRDLVDRVLPSVAANGTVDGRTYAVPNTQSQPSVLYYNRKLLDDAGVEPPATWEELMAAVEKLKGDGVTPVALAGQSVWPELMWIQYLTDRIGGPEAFQRVLDGKPGAWSQPAITEAATRIKELVDAGAFGEGFASVNADAGADVALVHTGRAAMLLQGSWVYPTFRSDAPDFVSDGKLGHTAFPTLEGGTGDPSNIVGNPTNFWSVSADAPKKAREAAVGYLNEEVFSEEHIDALLDTGTVPPVEGLEEKISEADDADYLGFVYDMVRDAEHFQLSWDQALPPGQAQELLTNLSKLFLGKSTPKQFTKAMDATL